jgi:thioredoxin reductase (NADPH)
VSDPIVFVVDDEGATLASLAGALERRFGADYRVLSDRSPVSALARLQEACDRGESIALLVADQWMPEMTGSTGSCRRASCAPAPRAAWW